MIKRTFLLFVGFMLLIALASPQAHAGKVRVNWRFAGTLINNILEFDLSTQQPTPTALVHGQLKGSPGRAELRSFSGKSIVIGSSPDCSGNNLLAISITENPIVITFRDLSLLFAQLKTGEQGDFCLDLSTGSGEGEIPIMFTGGRGRFEGANGWAVIKAETQAVSSNGNFSGETATVKGWVTLPHDNDDGDKNDD